MGLFDFFKRKPVAPPVDLPPETADRQGTGGASSIGGFLLEREKSPELLGRQRYVTYDNLMLNTAVVAAAVRYYHAVISGVGWSLKPGDGKNAERYAERVERMINVDAKTPWSQVVGTMSQYRWVGFSIQEWIAERMPDGFVGLTQFENRPQHTIEQWDLEPQSSEVLGWVQRHGGTGDDYRLDRAKCVYIADLSITHMPDGVGMLRHVAELQRQLRRLEQLEGWAYETDLRGIPIGWAPVGVLDTLVQKKIITEAQKADKLKGLQDFIQNHVRNPQLGIMLDSMPYRDEGPNKTPSVTRYWGLELAQGNGVGLAEINVAIDRKQREIARAIGFEHVMLGGDGKGSNAQHTDKTEGVRETISAILSTMARRLDQDVIIPTFLYNGWDLAQRPRFLPDALQLRSVQEVVDALEGMARSGAVIIPGDEVVDQVRDMLHLVRQPKITPEIARALLPSPKDTAGETKAKPKGG